MIPLALLLACAPAPDTGDSGVPEAPPRPLLLVHPPQLAEAAAAYAAYREETGWVVDLASTDALTTPTLVEGVTRRIAEAAGATEGLFVLLLGDADVTALGDPAFIPISVDSVGNLGDAPYVDLDGDEVPDLPIGRLPFQDGATVEAWLDRVRTWEATPAPDPTDRMVRLFTGVGGFGDVVDATLEYVGGLVVEEISYDYDFSVTTAIVGSEWYLPGTAWQQAWAEGYDAGSVLDAYVGHTLDGVPLEALHDPARRTLVGFFSCSNATFQDPSAPSLGEELLVMDPGPMGVLAATDVTHPYPNAVLARELSRVLLNDRSPTVGEAFLQARRDMIYRQDDLRQQLDQLAGAFIDDLPGLLASHVTLYNLLGDPTLSPRVAPAAIVFDDPEDSLPAGSTVSVGGLVAFSDGLPFDGEVHVTLEVRRSTVIHELAPVDEVDPDPATCLANHALANDKTLASATGFAVNGRFDVDLSVPDPIPDSDGYFLKGWASDGERGGSGSMEVTVWR